MINNQITITKQIINPPITKRNFDLEERTLQFSKDVIHLCKKLPQDTINRELVSQLIRAVGSVGANYREANNALSKKDFALRVKISRKEAKEAYYWLQLIEEANPASHGEIKSSLREAMELTKILSSIAQKTV